MTDKKRIKTLRNLTAHTHHGVKTPGGPRHVNTKDRILRSYTPYGRVFLKQLRNQDYLDHFLGVKTLYFNGAWRISDQETLALIDIDCHTRGTLQGAMAFAKYLAQTYFPGLYYETSTHGNGVHAYLIVGKKGVGGEFVNNALSHLQKVVRQHEDDFDIELVEIKGSCPIFTFAKDGSLKEVKAGTLAKLPRGDFATTTRINAYDIFKLPYDEHRQKKRTNQRGGSAVGKVIKDGELQRLLTVYLPLAQKIMTGNLKTSGKAVATVEDMAIFLLLLRFFTLNPNDDNSLPKARFAGLWNSLYQAGDVSRSFDCTRFKAIRDHLSDRKLIYWQNNEYRVGTKDRPGQACRWCAGDELMVLMGEEITTPLGRTTDKMAVGTPGEMIRPVLVSIQIGFRDHQKEIAAIVLAAEEQLLQLAG